MRRFVWPTLAAAAAAALVALLAFGVLSKTDDRTIDEALSRGEEVAAPSRTLPVLGEQGESAIADRRGEVVVLNFWASWCKPCREEAPALQAAQRELQRRRAGTVLGVAYRDTEPDAVDFARKYGLSYPSLRDTEGELARDYGTVALPETFIIDRAGRIVARQRGTVDRRWLDRELARVLRQPS